MTHARISLVLFLLGPFAGCLSGEAPPDDEVALVRVALTLVPSNAQCVRFTVQAGVSTSQQSFSVTPGTTALLTLTGLPPGPAILVAEAFNTTCSGVGSTTLPTWIGAPVMATLVAGATTDLSFTLRPPARVSGSLDFASLVVAPTSQAFGGVLVGTPSVSATIVVTNTASVVTGALTASLGGPNPGDFAIVGNSCGVLAGGSSCSIQVRFAPTSATMRAATLVVSASPGGTAIAALSGTGLPPATLSLSPASHDFGTVPLAEEAAHVFTLSNVGATATGPVSPPAFTGSDADQFLVVSPPCPALAPAASCSIDVRFRPTRTGPHTASMTLTAAPGGTASAALSGQALFLP